MSCAFNPSFSRSRTPLPISSGTFYCSQNNHDVSQHLDLCSQPHRVCGSSTPVRLDETRHDLRASLQDPEVRPFMLSGAGLAPPPDLSARRGRHPLAELCVEHFVPNNTALVRCIWCIMLRRDSADRCSSPPGGGPIALVCQNGAEGGGRRGFRRRGRPRQLFGRVEYAHHHGKPTSAHAYSVHTVLKRAVFLRVQTLAARASCSSKSR